MPAEIRTSPFPICSLLIVVSNGRSGKRHAPRRNRPRRAREARRPPQRELAKLVRSVHRGGAGRDRTAEVNHDLL